MSAFNKIMGVFMIIFGLFLARWFPTIPNYQYKGFSWLGVTFGIFFIYLGIYLVLH